VARYGVVLVSSRTTERELSVGLGAEIFPKGEIRVLHLRTFDSGLAAVIVELVGGSTWQPTGFRR
jgi:hypothetical protein